MSKKMTILYNLPFFLLGIASPVHAQTQDEPLRIDSDFFDNLLGQNGLVFRYLFPLSGLICFLFIVKGGYMWMMSSGDPEKVKRAQGTLTWSVIGMVFVLLTRLILDLVFKIIQ